MLSQSLTGFLGARFTNIMLSFSGLLFASIAFGAVCPCGAPPECGSQPAFCYETPKPSRTVVCETDSESKYGKLEFLLNRRKKPVNVEFGATNCPMRFKVESDRWNYYDANLTECENRPEDLLGISYRDSKHALSVRVEVTYDRIPDDCENTRVCNPENVGYTIYRCKRK